jgi:hypothetical protein
VLNNLSLPTANAGTTANICQGGTTAALNGTVGGSATGGTWTTPAGGTFSPDANTLNATWTPPPGYSGTAVLTLTTTGMSPCSAVTSTVSIVVNPTNTIAAAPANSNQTVCSGVAISNITYATTGATGVSVSGLPTGLNGTWAGNVVTISGTPNVPGGGTFNYTVTMTGGCTTGQATRTGTITVTPTNTSSVASSTPTLCISTTLTAITHTTTGATGIGTVTGLPAGVTAAFAGNTITISGTPTASGTFNYSIQLTGGCGAVNATGTIIVTPNNTAAAPSSSPTLCINTALSNITIATTGATGIGTVTGLPAGVTAAFAGNTITISGTPTASGTFNYSIQLTGGCGAVNATGTIIVTPNNTAAAPSSSPTLCINTALSNITIATTGATGIGTVTGLPAGVTAAFAGNTITISGTPTASGTFNYSIQLTGGCGAVNATGTITVNPNLPASVSVSASATTICAGTSVTFTATPTNGGTSPQYQWFVNGTAVSGATASTYTTTTLANNDQVTVQLTSNATPCLTGSPATSTAIVITVNPNLPASVSVSASATTICAGTSVTFTATPTNAGTSPQYQWFVNGTAVSGATASTYTTTTLANNDQVTVQLTSNATPCLTGSPATSTAIVITVNPNLPASVSVSASATTICAGTSVTFTATPTNAGTSPQYQWFVNGTAVSGATASTYTTTTLANNDQVTVQLTSNATPCLTGSPATSTAIVITVNPNLPASVSVSASATTICAGTSVTFTATPTNAGTSPQYQWFVNGTAVSGATASTYTTTTLANNDQVTVQLTSNATPCLTGSPATSTAIVITVNPNLPASVSVSASATTICAGTSVTFTATPTNAGTSPQYQWFVNGTAVSGATASTYTTTTLANNDQVTVQLTSNATPCLTGSPATSTAIVITVNPNLPASVSVSASATTICAGTSVTFTATPTNAGTSPQYQWFVNGTAVSGATASTYTTTTLANNDQVTVQLTSNATPCLTGSPATSTAIVITVNPNSSITSQNTATQTVCINASFSALTVTAAGVGLSYQWYSNTTASTTGGTLIGGATNSNYTPDASVEGTTYYYVEVTGTCGTVTSAVSGAMIVNPAITALISGDISVCLNDAAPDVTFTNPLSLPIILTYNVNGGANQNLNIAANSSVTVTQPTTIAGTFTYNLVSAAYQSAPNCAGILIGSVDVIVRPTITASISGDTTVCINDAPPFVTFTNPLPFGIIITYNINGGVDQQIAVAANASIDIIHPTDISGTFIYTITHAVYRNNPLCPEFLNGSITIIVNQENLIQLSSATGTDNQTLCQNTALNTITYTTSGATGATVSGLPAGVTGTWSNGVVTVSGTPIVPGGGTFNYTITMTGGCTAGQSTATGTIVVTPGLSSSISGTNVLCFGNATGAADLTVNWRNSSL